MESNKEGDLLERIAKHIEFREGEDYFAFSTCNMRDAEIQDITPHEFWGLVKDIVGITEHVVNDDTKENRIWVNKGRMDELINLIKDAECNCEEIAIPLCGRCQIEKGIILSMLEAKEKRDANVAEEEKVIYFNKSVKFEHLDGDGSKYIECAPVAKGDEVKKCI